jgi:hypothetical protein
VLADTDVRVQRVDRFPNRYFYYYIPGGIGPYSDRSPAVGVGG